MNIKFLRASSINTYRGCEFQFFMEQVLEIPSKAGKKAFLGTIVHHVLELMAKGSMVKRNFGFITDHKKLLDICWNRYTKESPEFNLKDSDKKFCIKTIEKVLNTSYDPRRLNVIATEYQFKIPMKSKDFNFEYYDLTKGTVEKGQYEIRGTIDLITELDKDTLEIIDWKTGSRKCWNTGDLKEYEYLYSKDVQLKMYDLATSILFPQYKNRVLTIHYINDGGPFTVNFDDNDRASTEKMIKETFNSIKWNQMPSRIKETKASDRWKCKSTCYFGKTLTKSGASLCDTIHSYAIGNGIDDTLLKVSKMKKEKAFANEVKTSNRRNSF